MTAPRGRSVPEVSRPYPLPSAAPFGHRLLPVSPDASLGITPLAVHLASKTITFSETHPLFFFLAQIYHRTKRVENTCFNRVWGGEQHG